jgi:leader peptidase (prepilin peptidase) / N-methyltransferase
MAMAVIEVGAALLGACVGSFLNVVIWRLPQEDPRKRSLGGRSHCPNCGAKIRWHDNLPILGWLLLRGRARCCGQPFSIRYPLVELLTAALFLVLAIWPPYGPAFVPLADGSYAVHTEAAVAMLLHAIFLSLLIANSFIDLDHQLLLDVLTKPGMAIGLFAGIWPGLAGPISTAPDSPLALRTLLGSVIGLLAGGGVTWAIRIVGTKVFRKEAMGFGDVKFMGMIGAFLGWKSALLTMFLGCVFGALIGGVGVLFGGAAKIPFGPFLALGALVAMFAADPILDFLFVTWPEWQRSSPSAQWFLPVLALLSLFALFVLVRRGRR